MARSHLPNERLVITHLPTFLLMVGYPLFWLELYIFKPERGITSPAACFVAVLLFLFLLKKDFPSLREVMINIKIWISQQNLRSQTYIVLASLLSFLILAIGLYAAFLPPHLPQETDVLTYHYMVPRQLLMRGSFEHIPWSTCDLLLLPINFALAPFWFFTPLPNKFPQFLFLMGLLFVSLRIISQLSNKNLWAAWLLFFGMVGSHNISIQMGTAMLDIVIAYLMIAAIDSLISKRYLLCAVEFTFYFWSKSFMPIKVILVVTGLLILYGLFKWFKSNRIGLDENNIFVDEEKQVYAKVLKKILVIFLFASIFIGGPFVAKTIYYAGTPLFPFFPGMVHVNKNIDPNSSAWQAILKDAKEFSDTTHVGYGFGTSLPSFLKYLWIGAVPTEGVNNPYDYPLGLMYLLCLGPFIYVLFKSIKNKQYLILPLYVAVFFGVWWISAQQTRFLYVATILILIIVLSKSRFHTSWLKLGILLSLLLTSLSVVRCHWHDFGRSHEGVLRQKDQELVRIGKRLSESQVVQVNYDDVAFADFPVDVVDNHTMFVLDYKSNPN